MSKRDGTRDALDRLRVLESDGPTDKGLATVKKFLQHRSNHVVAKACDLVSKWRAESLIPELESAVILSFRQLTTRISVNDKPGHSRCPVDRELFLMKGRYLRHAEGCGIRG